MFKVPIESIDKGNPLRQKGKIAELACIAESQLVLTDKGLVPIEEVTLAHKLWDGEGFTNHDGIVFKGIKEVLTYEGLTATTDHLIWVEGKDRPIQFGEAASSKAHLLQSGAGGQTIWISENNKRRKKMEKRLEGTLCTSKMRRMWENTVGTVLQSYKRKIKRLSAMFTAKKGPKMVGSKIHRGETKMHKPERPKLQKLWRKRDRIPFQFCFRRLSLDGRELRTSREENGIRQNRRQWPLRARQSSMGNASGELSKPAKVYDILNCGKNNRFTVSNVLVHNCGYGGSIGALKAMDRKWAESVPEEELQSLIKQWRSSNVMITKLWHDIENAAKQAIEDSTTVEIQKGIKFIYTPGLLFIQLPSGRKLAYVKPKLEESDKFPGCTKITYEGMDQTSKNWVRMDTYGGKLVENVVQATARDCLAEAMLRLDQAGYKIAFHVHDEVVLDVPAGYGSLEEVNEIMGTPIPWAPDLPLTADGYECQYYQKD
jgi:DNA polymerase bacteriophage-type